MHINLHTVPLVRRTAASLVGALIALTVHSAYQDTTAALLAHKRHVETMHGAADLPGAAVAADPAERVRAFAEQLKKQRAE